MTAANLSGADLRGAKKLFDNKLGEAGSLNGALLDQNLKEQLLFRCPEIFEKPLD